MNATRRKLSGFELIPFDILPCAPPPDGDEDDERAVGNI